MSKYQLRFWFEHGGGCIWGMNYEATQKYGYMIKGESLFISDNLISELITLENEYATYLDWAYPPNPSPWTEEHKIDFFDKATSIYEKLKDELGADFDITNGISQCIK